MVFSTDRPCVDNDIQKRNDMCFERGFERMLGCYPPWSRQSQNLPKCTNVTQTELFQNITKVLDLSEKGERSFAEGFNLLH